MSNKELLKKILKVSKIKETSLLSESEIYNNETFVPSKIPCLNLYLSGNFDGGLAGNHLMIAGEPSSFKSMIGLILLKTYLDFYEDGIAIFYDSEKGITKDYLKSLGINSERVVIKPFYTLEQLRNDLIGTLEELNSGDHVIILIDSVTASSSSNEIKSSLEGKETVDMQRAKVVKSVFRQATTYVSFKKIPLISINHIYTDLGNQYNHDGVVSGGKGGMYSCTACLLIKKLKGEKGEGGFDFRIKVKKSRYVKEELNFLLNIPEDGKLRRLSGLFELALDYGYIVQSGAWYEVPSVSDYSEKKYRKAELRYNKDLWHKIFTETDFKEKIENAVKVSQDQSSIFNDLEEETLELTQITSDNECDLNELETL
jgi:RecA/RadA recombinase